MLRTFVYAPVADRVGRAKIRPDAKEMPDRMWESQLAKHDRARASYYNYYSDKKWGDGSSYNMCIDSGVCGIDGTVQLIKDFVALKEKIKG